MAEETLLLTVELVAELSNDLLIGPWLPADQYNYDLDWIRKVKIVKPDNQVVEKDAEFGMPLDTLHRVYILLITNTKKDEVPIGSQIWIKNVRE